MRLVNPYIWLFIASVIVAGRTSLAQDQNNVSNASNAGVRFKLNAASEVFGQREIKGPNGPVRVDRSSVKLITLMHGSPAKDRYLNIIREPETGYVWWWLGDSTPQMQVPWADSFWLIPELGIASVHAGGAGIGMMMQLSKSKADSFEQLRTKILPELEASFNGGKPCLGYDELRVNVREIIGDDFFLRFGDASIPQPVSVVSVGYSNSTWRIEIESPLTHENAVIDLDLGFNVTRAVRAGKQVFPKP